jgi:hypothetical protein
VAALNYTAISTTLTGTTWFSQDDDTTRHPIGRRRYPTTLALRLIYSAQPVLRVNLAARRSTTWSNDRETMAGVTASLH